jgi:DNA-binding HxlR family transcriptional regulator
MSPDRIYRHFCMMARALEVVGERWTLSDRPRVAAGPAAIHRSRAGPERDHPARLTARLRLLESEGLITRDASQPGRDVWYSLTDAGSDLGSVIDALTLWGIQHGLEGPVSGEPVPPHPTMIGTKVWLNRFAPKLPDGLAWVWRFPGEDDYTLRLGDGAWRLSGGGDSGGAVTVRSTKEAWARFLTSPRNGRRLPTDDISIQGSRAQLRRFAKGFAAELVD